MPKINEYSSLDTISGGDLLAVYDVSNSDTRKTSMSALAAYVLAQDTASDTAGLKQEYTTQYAAPSATGFNVQITDGSDNIWLVLTPTGGFAAGTITLPLKANVADKQEVMVITTQAVTALTVDGNGVAGVVGEPTTLAANDYFKLKYDALYDTWYRIG